MTVVVITDKVSHVKNTLKVEVIIYLSKLFNESCNVALFVDLISLLISK